MAITVRSARPQDMSAVLEMMRALTGEEYDFGDEVVFVAEQDGRALAGFLSLSLRPWAEGCASMPVPYIEGWWIEPEHRRCGIGRALMLAAENWCRAHGYVELGSDADVVNRESIRAHHALGFESTMRLQFFRRRL